MATSSSLSTTISRISPVFRDPPAVAAAVSSVTGGGIGNGSSTMRQSDDVLETPRLQPNLNSNAPPLASSATESSPSPGKVVRDDPPSSDANSSMATVQMKITRILQRFLVRSPHTFIAMAATFFPLYYGLDKENLAYSATTFVGVGGTVYCLTRAINLEVIPHWLLPRTKDTRVWRHLMNVTYTAFITVMFTSAVWKLPDLSAAQGLFFLTVSFGVPYRFLATFYPDTLDKTPSLYQQNYDVPTENETY